jgi:hypothetical protein
MCIKITSTEELILNPLTDQSASELTKWASAYLMLRRWSSVAFNFYIYLWTWSHTCILRIKLKTSKIWFVSHVKVFKLIFQVSVTFNNFLRSRDIGHISSLTTNHIDLPNRWELSRIINFENINFHVAVGTELSLVLLTFYRTPLQLLHNL